MTVEEHRRLSMGIWEKEPMIDDLYEPLTEGDEVKDIWTDELFVVGIDYHDGEVLVYPKDSVMATLKQRNDLKRIFPSETPHTDNNVLDWLNSL